MMIRIAQLEDLPQLLELEQVCFADAWSAGLLEGVVKGPYDSCLVMEEQGKLTGYAVLRTVADESEIQRIAILPTCRRRGYARELLERMVEDSRAQGSQSLILEVRSANQAARRLYKTGGFGEEGVRRGYYRNPTDDAVLMRLALV